LLGTKQISKYGAYYFQCKIPRSPHCLGSTLLLLFELDFSFDGSVAQTTLTFCCSKANVLWQS